MKSINKRRIKSGISLGHSVTNPNEYLVVTENPKGMN